MRDYPTLIKNLKISEKMDKIADELREQGLVLKGTIIPNEDRVIFSKSNNEFAEYNNVEHNAYCFLAARENSDFQEINSRVGPEIMSLKKNVKHDLPEIGTLATMGVLVAMECPDSTSIIGLILVLGLGGVASSHEISLLHKINKLDKLLMLDSWFADNLKIVNEMIEEGNPLLKKISPKAKEIINKPNIAGDISLNNIQDFPINDLKVIRKFIQKEQEKVKGSKQKIKISKRGM